MNLGLREVVSEEPHPKHEPQPHANTFKNKNKTQMYALLTKLVLNISSADEEQE